MNYEAGMSCKNPYLSSEAPVFNFTFLPPGAVIDMWHMDLGFKTKEELSKDLRGFPFQVHREWSIRIGFKIPEAERMPPWDQHAPRERLQYGPHALNPAYREALWIEHPHYCVEEVLGSYLGHNEHFDSQEDWLAMAAGEADGDDDEEEDDYNL
mmetsp:Transcript_14744/g.37217  ORF Transcript_14744/g.37217 Transcript_14744/m.37217 type:complete len:154 (-) Transcript_14744:132-593(-)